MKSAIVTILLVSFAVCAFGQDEPPQLQRANLITRSTTDLAAEIHRIAAEETTILDCLCSAVRCS
jgi:hypothetical protein